VLIPYRYDYCVEVDGGSSTTSPTSSSTTSKSTTSLPFPTQSGIIATCNKFKDAESGDFCSKFAADNGITIQQLYAWNSILGPNGENCGTQFQAGVDYCIGVSATSTTKLSTSSTSSLPFPTQSGIIATCNKFKDAESGDYCSKFASDNGITTQQLYAWNAILGSNGENCGTQFQAGVDYCVGVSATSTTKSSTSSTSTTKIPTQTGIAANCNKIAVAKNGDFCFQFAQDNSTYFYFFCYTPRNIYALADNCASDITPQQLYTWNPVLGPNGENCNLQFQAGEGYCVSVSS
jgi:LysM repeat protein